MDTDDEHDVEFASDKGGHRARTVARFYRAMDYKLREVEKRIERAAEGGGCAEVLTAADSERDARTLGSLARLFEKVAELDDAGRIAGSGDATSDPGPEEIDADRFRQEIAERLAFAPITFSASGDTSDTVRQIRGHNAAWDEICTPGQ